MYPLIVPISEQAIISHSQQQHHKRSTPLCQIDVMPTVTRLWENSFGVTTHRRSSFSFPRSWVRRDDDGGGIRIRHFGGYIVHCLWQGVINLLVLCIVYVCIYMGKYAGKWMRDWSLFHRHHPQLYCIITIDPQCHRWTIGCAFGFPGQSLI